MQNYQNQQQAEENRLRDDARSNLTTLANLAVNAGKSYADLDIDMRTQLSSLEVRAGFPSGTMAAFLQSKPKTKIISTTKGQNDQGEDIVTFIYEDPATGRPGVVVIKKTGGVSSGGFTSTTKAGGFFTDTQLAKGAAKADMSLFEFSNLTVDEANKFVQGVVDEVANISEFKEKIVSSLQSRKDDFGFTRDQAEEEIVNNYTDGGKKELPDVFEKAISEAVEQVYGPTLFQRFKNLFKKDEE